MEAQVKKQTKLSLLVAINLIAYVFSGAYLCAQDSSQKFDKKESIFTEDFVEGAKFGFAAGFFPVVGTVGVGTMAALSPLTAFYNVFVLKNNYDPITGTFGLVLGHGAGLVTELALIAYAYKKAGLKGGAVVAVGPMALLGLLQALDSAEKNKKN